MKDKITTFYSNNIRRKRTWLIIITILFIVVYFIFKTPNSAKNIITDIAKISDIKETVLATGQVVSSTDLKLSFNGAGVVNSIKVKVGDKVRAGQVLATLDSGAELASLTSARGALAAAKARYRRVIEGASNEELTLSEIALANTKRDYENIKRVQETLVLNAYNNMLNSSLEAVPEDGTSDFNAPIISGNYTLGKEGKINLKPYYSVSGTSFSTTGLVVSSGVSNTITAQPLGDSGLYIKFPNNTNINVDEWVINIPNKKATNYLLNNNAYQSALKSQESALSSAQSAIDQRTAELAIKKSNARGSEIDLANADILSAEGQVQAALARYNNTLIKAPVVGTITSIDIKVGELAVAQRGAIILQDVSNIYLETNINEANISTLKLDMPVSITYDSFGEDKIFEGKITKIDPSSTLISGVVNYKITVSTEQLKELRPGMTANMTIKVNEKNNVIGAPIRSIITDDNGVNTIRLITNKKNKKWKEVEVTLGLEGDGGQVEILNGLNEGDEYVVLIKK